MNVKQFIMAYRAEHSSIKALLSDEYESLRPVLRINVEIITHDSQNTHVRIEFNTPVASRGKRGWLNLKTWESPATEIKYETLNKHVGEKTEGSEDAVKGFTTQFRTEFLTIEYTGVGIVGGCPAENDNDGCFYLDGDKVTFIESETIDAFKEYCDCEFKWEKAIMPAMEIPVEKILGAYQVEFNRPGK
ncbi:MAG: hypothetical protein PHW03_06985 [Eubacteriales bacterium]|nr:hypothetical protein [Eubacteriales bacterium]MDD4390530.1 hypothetical protein [Eubacteriales bacterium]